MNYNYRLTIDKYPQFEFTVTTRMPLLAGEQIMLFPRNCRLLCRVVSVCKYFSQELDENDQPIIDREIEDDGAVYTSYSLLDDSRDMAAELKLERILPQVTGKDLEDIIPNFEDGWKKSDEDS